MIPASIVTCGLMEKNLGAKLADADFCHDCDSLIVGGAVRFGYDAREAGRIVMKEIVSLL